jgi:hypothetical protein
MRGMLATGRLAFRLTVSFSILAPWLAAVPAFAQVPSCLLVEARATPSGDGKYDHSLTFINGCDVRMHLTARYSDAPDSEAGRDIVGTGETATIRLGFSQPKQAFSAHYDVRFGGGSEGRSTKKVATGTSRATASRSKSPPRSLSSSAPRGGALPISELCDRALRQIFKLQGVSEQDSTLKDRVANCPSRVNRDPQKRRAELECALGASTGEALRTCFGAK